MSCALLAGGCSLDTLTGFDRRAITPPQNWQDTTSVEAVRNGWLTDFNRESLTALVNQAMEDNLELKQLAYDAEIRQQQLTQAGASFFPALDLGFSRGRSGTTDTSDAVNTATLSLDVAYEVDIWGKLSDAEKQAKRNLMQARAAYEQARQQLAADVAIAWLKVIEAKRRLDLYQQRVTRAQTNHAIIEGGYEKGLNAALDIYLIRNELDTERSRVASQEAVLSDEIRTLERLIGEYPKGVRSIAGTIPELTAPVRPGLPGDLITRKASLAASWNGLLSANAALAFAHKQRLPSLNLSASLKDSADRGTNLFSGDALAWSLLGSITAPIFDAGNLEAAAEVAQLQLRQAEFKYLSDLYNAYQDVENAIALEESLKRQNRSNRLAENNAKTALDLSFEQYQRGLIDYATVLTAQTRYHDAQDAAIRISSQLVENRINLHVALGGDFSLPHKPAETEQ